MHWYLPFSCLFFVSVNIFSQVQVSGFVKNIYNLPVQRANIQLLSEDSLEVVSFTTSDAAGYFNITTSKTGDYLLKATAFGYQKEEVRITLTQNLQIDIELTEDTITELKEVTVSGYPKTFKVKEDTLSYNINAVKDGTERNLGEALNKLPGISVDDDGKVSFQGKKIDKILVDGNEFFGNKHQMATRNLTPDMIAGINILTNYKENSLDMRGSKIAMDLRLKDEYKGSYIGNVAALGGVVNKYLAHANVFKFKERGNIGLITDFNTTGETPITLEDYIEMRGGIAAFLSATGAQVTTLDETQFPKFVFSDINMKSKNNQFAALNLNSKLSDKTEVNAYTLLNNIQQKEQLFTEKVFYDTSNLDFRERTESTGKILFNNTYLTAKYNPNEQNLWNYQFTLTPNTDNFRQNIQFENEAATENYRTKASNTNLSLGHSLQHVYKLNDRWFLQNSFSQNYLTAHQDLRIEADTTFLGLNFEDETYVVNQQYKTKNLDHLFDSELTLKKEKTQYKAFIGAEDKRSAITSTIHEFPDDFSNDFNLHNTFYKVGFSGNSFLTDRFYINFFNRVLYFRSKHTTVQSKWLYEPKMSLGYNFSLGEKITLSSGISNEFPTIEKIIENPLVADYRTLLQNRDVRSFQNIPVKNISLNYFSFDVKKEALFSVEARYTQKKNNIIKFNEVSPEFILNQFIYSPEEKNYYAHILYDRKFQNIPFSFKNFTSLHYTRGINFIGASPSDFINQIFSWNVTINSTFKNSPLQFDAGVTYSNNQFKQELIEQTAAIKKITSFIKLRGKATRFNWELKGTNLYQDSNLGTNSLVFVSPYIRYLSKNQLWEFFIDGNNIFHLDNNSLLTSSFDNVSTSQSQVSILSGYLMTGVKYIF